MGNKKHRNKKIREVKVMISPEKAKFLGLHPSEVVEQDLDKAFAIDWDTEKREFVDIGHGYAYKPGPTPFNDLRDAFYAANGADAQKMLAQLCTMAHASGIPVSVVIEWAENQMRRWHRERQWSQMH